MKFLIINNIYPPQELGGYGRLMFDFANILQERGHTVEVLTSDTEYLGVIPLNEENITRTLKLYGGWKDGRCWNMENNKCVEIISQNTQTIIGAITGLRPNICLLGNIDFIGNHTTINHICDTMPVIHHLGNQSPGYLPQHTPQYSNYVIATASNWLKDHIKKQGYTPKRTEIVYPGALTDYYYNASMQPIDKLKILFSGIVLPYKGIHTLIKALLMLHDDGIDYQATIAGTTTDTVFRDVLINTVHRYGLSEKIKFVGNLSRERLKAYYQQYNTLVFPSEVNETFGISQVEAMAAGCLVVSTARGGSQEIIMHEKTGYTFQSGHCTDLLNVLKSIDFDRRTSEKIRRSGQSYAMNNFNIQNSVKKIERIAGELWN